jgi:uncharacterized membrane protein YphA (DoxX/SURF4 family)
MLTTILLLSTAAAQPGIGVMDFAAEGGASAELASALSTVVGQELERLEVFKVSNAQTTRIMLGLERQKALMGCEDCGGEALKDMMTYDSVVTGKVVKTEGTLTLFLSLVSVGQPKPSSSVHVSAPTDAKLMMEVGPAVTKLVGKMLEGKQGQLVVTSSEVGASVKVDDTQVGTTPLSAPVKLAGGPHFVSVEKDGYTTSRRDVRINPERTLEEHFTLVPSPDTIKAYEAKSGRTRTLVWGTAGLAVAGFALFFVGQGQADGFYGTDKTKGTFLYAQSKLASGIETDGTVNFRAEATNLRNAVVTWEIVSGAALVVGGVSAIASAVLFVIGEPPDKYKAFHAGLFVTPGASGLSFAGSF